MYLLPGDAAMSLPISFGIAGDDRRPSVGMQLGFVKFLFDEGSSIGEDLGVGLVGERVGGYESGAVKEIGLAKDALLFRVLEK